MQKSLGPFSPLVLLDVDGTINAVAIPKPHDVLWPEFRSHGYRVRIPDYMPALVQKIAGVAEIHWCSTWRKWANDDIADHLGVGPFPVVDDGSDDRGTGWKAAAAYDVAAEALDRGRRVIWFEDFYGEPPINDMPAGVEFVDTADESQRAVLTEKLVTETLPEIAVADLWANSPLPGVPQPDRGWALWREIGETHLWPGIAGAHFALDDVKELLRIYVEELDLRLRVEDKQPAHDKGGHETDIEARNSRNHEVIETATADIEVALSLLQNVWAAIAHRWST